MSLQTRLTAILSGAPTGMSLDAAGIDDCRCAAHQSIECGVEGAVGCRGKSPGTHASIAALYARRSARYCHAEYGVRVLDVKFSGFCMSYTTFSFLGGKYRPVVKYMKGAEMGLEKFGAGYCYMDPAYPGARMRVARVLGPCPLIVDVLRVLMVVGSPEVREYSLEEVAPSCWHVNYLSEHAVPTRGFVEALLSICAENGEARIGIGAEDFRALEDFMASRGIGHEDVRTMLSLSVEPECRLYRSERVRSTFVPGLSLRGLVMRDGDLPPPVIVQLLNDTCAVDLPKTAFGDVWLLTAQSVQQAVMAENGRSRVRLFANLGDSVLRIRIAVRIFADDDFTCNVGKEMEMAANVALARMFVACPITQPYQSVALSVAERATFVEALIGIALLYVDFDAAVCVAHEFLKY